LRFALSIGSALFSAALVYGALDRSLHRERTFFGTYRVRVTEGESFRRLLHGTTLHGAQSFEPDRQHLALTYYSAAGPVGQLFDRVDRLKRPGTRIGAVGLGVGSIAAYVGAGQELTFFELDPAVERIARTPTLFTHLDQCGSQCRVVVGDARLSLQRSTDTYALIVLDAFSSDAIPIHLLTREAFVLYLAHLTPDGILAVHVSNRHLNLVPIVARLAEHTGLFMLYQAHSPTSVEREAGIAASTWAVLATNPSVLDALRVDVRWSEPERIPSTPLWTDDFSNILSALKIPFFRS
jgi:hypothetical protein